jgi:hypothetical protein
MHIFIVDTIPFGKCKMHLSVDWCLFKNYFHDSFLYSLTQERHAGVPSVRPKWILNFENMINRVNEWGKV